MLDRRLLAVLMVSGAMAELAHAQTPESKAPPSAMSQAPKPQSTGSLGRGAAANADENPGPTITVEFPGGNAKAFVEAVRNAGGQKFNVIMPKEAENEPIPAVSLREVTAFTALQTLEFSAPANGMFQFQVATIGNASDPNRTFAIRYGPRYPQSGIGIQMSQPSSRQETRVFSIRELVEAPESLASNPEAAATVETVVNALRAATQVDSDTKTPTPELMLHKESNLLIVRATQEQIRTMESVLQALTSNVVSRRNAAIDAAQRARAAKVEQAEFQTQMDLNKKQLDESERALDEARARAGKLRDAATPEKPLVYEQQEANSALRLALERRDTAVARQRALDERAAVNQARAAAGAEPGTTGGGAGNGGGGSAEFPVAVNYSFLDLKAFDGDVNSICRAIVPFRRDGLEPALKVNSPGNIVFRATPSEHKILVAALNAMRRAKANEPSLPGQDAAELIRKNEVK
jgi:hypothetical protein